MKPIEEPVLERIRRSAIQLRERLDVSRVTVRVVLSDGSDRLIAEALADGEVTLGEDEISGNDGTIPGTTYWHILRELEPLIQDTFEGDTPQPPDDLIHEFKVQAQMLSPILAEGKLVGLISAHQAHRTRTWTSHEVWELGRTTGVLVDVLAGLDRQA